MNELPISTITPEGWLRRYLELQRDGLTGNLQHFGYPFDRGGWMEHIPLQGEGCDWWPYEQAYKGFSACADRFHVEDVTLARLLSRRRSTLHGVSFAEMAKLPAILYMLNGDGR